MKDSACPDLVVVFFLLSTFASYPVRSVVYEFVFEHDVPGLPAGTLMVCFVELRTVRLVSVKGRCR